MNFVNISLSLKLLPSNTWYKLGFIQFKSFRADYKAIKLLVINLLKWNSPDMSVLMHGKILRKVKFKMFQKKVPINTKYVVLPFQFWPCPSNFLGSLFM